MNKERSYWADEQMGLIGLIVSSSLQAQKLMVASSRWAILSPFNEEGLNHMSPFNEEGLKHTSQLALQNCKDLLPILPWNHEHNIRLFRCFQA